MLAILMISTLQIVTRLVFLSAGLFLLLAIMRFSMVATMVSDILVSFAIVLALSLPSYFSPRHIP